MASCYLCGQGGADYRRTVVTGQSRGTYYGKRSTSYSTRTYSGLRTVCEDCAYSIDKSRLVGKIVVLWIVALVLVWLIIEFKF